MSRAHCVLFLFFLIVSQGSCLLRTSRAQDCKLAGAHIRKLKEASVSDDRDTTKGVRYFINLVSHPVLQLNTDIFSDIFANE
jgi:hypothetical protein